MLFDSNPPSPPPPPDPNPSPSWEWERLNCFRATFLYLFLPEDRATFTAIGLLLYNLITEAPALGADDFESSTFSELKAAAQDCRHLGAFLASVGNERHVSHLGLEDQRLSLMAERWATDVDRVGAEIDAVLNSHLPEPPSGPAVRFGQGEG
jgi:hypothetical protein